TSSAVSAANHVLLITSPNARTPLRTHRYPVVCAGEHVGRSRPRPSGREGSAVRSTMSRRGRVTAVAAALLAVGSIGAGGVIAASRSGDEAALQTIPRGGDRGIEHR